MSWAAPAAIVFAIGLSSCAIGCGGDGQIDLGNGTGDDDATSADESGSEGGFDLDAMSDTSTCTPRTCAAAGANCGPIADGCGGLVDCGTCAAPATCGGGGTPSVCGGTSGCVKKTCADLGANCGPQGDGCGGLLDCGTCTAPETCGGSGVPSVCGKPGTLPDGGSSCVKKTCASLGYDCGPAADGCGGLLDCGTCTSPSICGGGGKPSVCGSPATSCVKKTCADYGATCGPVADGCGGVIASCGTCTSPDICGGGGKPSVCGGGTTDSGTPVCTGLACSVPTCAAGTTTSISGTVYDPAGKVPLYNIYVYVPNAAVAKFVDGATCDKCADALSGSPITWTTTDTKGQFKLTGVPAGTNIPVVIQSGKWRRQFKMNTTACKDNPVLDANLSRLPRNKSEGDIPKIALTTGGADPLECLLRKIGIDDAEFTNPTGTGRVNLYTGTGGTSKYTSTLNAGATFPNATTLWDTEAHLGAYDVVLFACEGAQNIGTKPLTSRQAVQQYAGIGGRLFMSHWHNVWLEQGPAPWPTVATWNFAANPVSPMPGTIDTSFPKGAALADWMVNVGGSTTKGTFSINQPRHTVDAVNASTSTRWVYANGVKDITGATIATSVQYFTFNAPVGVAADTQCGRVVFSDIHVSSGDTVNKAFPTGCTTVGLTPQEKALEFMFFDLTSRVCSDTAPPPPPKCTPLTCAGLGLSCGPAADGCGGLLNCGTCTAPATCGGGGTPGKCGTPTCTPKTCAQMMVSCGPSGDGCGGVIDCGTCPPPDGSTCVPMTCGGRCGPQGDGCGGLLSCPACPGGTCTPTTCALAGADCGMIADGCGGALNCGSCVAPATCGGGGTPNKCGGIK